jgi:hypothetical protein
MLQTTYRHIDTITDFVLGESVYLVTPNNTDPDRYYFKFEDTLDLSVIRELTWAQVQSTMALSEFYGHPFVLVSDDIVSSEFTILGMSKLPNKLVYLPTDRITLSDFKLGHPVYLVTPNNTDPDRYYFKFDTIPDSFMNVRMLTNRLTKRRKLLRYFYRQPFYLACNGIVSSKFIINAPKSTGTLNMSSSTTSQTTTMYQTSETITLSNLTPGKPVYLVTPNNADTPSKYYYQVSPTNDGSVKANLGVIQSLTLYQSTSTQPFNTFYGQSFYFACNQVVSNQFTITNRTTLTMNPESPTPTSTINVSNLTVFRPIYLVTPNNTEPDRYYFEFPNTSTSTQVDLNTITKFTCANNNTLTMTLSQLEEEPFYFACNSLISPEFKITDSTPATLALNVEGDQIQLTATSLDGPATLFTVDEYYSAVLTPIVDDVSSTAISSLLLTHTSTSYPIRVFDVEFKARADTIDSNSMKITTTPSVSIQDKKVGQDLDLTDFTGKKYLTTYDTNDTYVHIIDAATTISLVPSLSFVPLFPEGKTPKTLAQLLGKFYVADATKISFDFAIEDNTPSITTKPSYEYTEYIELTSSGITGSVTLYNGTYSVGIGNFTTGSLVVSSEIDTIDLTDTETLPLIVFTVVSSASQFKASCGDVDTILFTISPPSPIHQDPVLV